MYTRYSIVIRNWLNWSNGFTRSGRPNRSIKTRKYGSTRTAGHTRTHRRNRRNCLQHNHTWNHRIKCRNPHKSIPSGLFPKWKIRHFRSIEQRNHTNRGQRIRPRCNRAKIQQYLHTSSLRRRRNNHCDRPHYQEKHGDVVRRDIRRSPLHLYRRIQCGSHHQIGANFPR